MKMSKNDLLAEAEQAFLTKLQGYGEIEPMLISSDNILNERIHAHPALHWKIKRKI